MIVIDGKAHRNMPEQVAKNQEDIKKIFQILDGLNIQDNVVVIDDITVPLTLTELEIINREVAFLVYNDQLFIKKNQDASTAYFDVVFSISGSSVITFTAKEIQVTLSNGGLNLITSTFYSYSKDEMDTLLGAKASISYVDTALLAKANLNGANFTGAITAPSIIENMSGYSFTKKSSDTDKTLTYLYAGVCKNGNKVTFVVFVKVTRLQTITVNSIPLGTFSIPSSVADKLYPYQGNWLNTLKVYGANTYVSGVEIPCLITKGTNAISIQLNGVNTAMTAETEYLIRVEQTFLLSDNLAV